MLGPASCHDTGHRLLRVGGAVQTHTPSRLPEQARARVRLQTCRETQALREPHTTTWRTIRRGTSLTGVQLCRETSCAFG